MAGASVQCRSAALQDGRDRMPLDGKARETLDQSPRHVLGYALRTNPTYGSTVRQ
jgi:hypothetical protein